MGEKWKITSERGIGFGEGTKYGVTNTETGEHREVIVTTNNHDKAAQRRELWGKISRGEFSN